MKNFQRTRKNIFHNINNLQNIYYILTFKKHQRPLKIKANCSFLIESDTSQYHFYTLLTFFFQLPNIVYHKVTTISSVIKFVAKKLGMFFG